MKIVFGGSGSRFTNDQKNMEIHILSTLTSGFEELLKVTDKTFQLGYYNEMHIL